MSHCLLYWDEWTTLIYHPMIIPCTTKKCFVCQSCVPTLVCSPWGLYTASTTSYIPGKWVPCLLLHCLRTTLTPWVLWQHPEKNNIFWVGLVFGCQCICYSLIYVSDGAKIKTLIIKLIEYVPYSSIVWKSKAQVYLASIGEYSRYLFQILINQILDAKLNYFSILPIFELDTCDKSRAEDGVLGKLLWVSEYVSYPLKISPFSIFDFWPRTTEYRKLGWITSSVGNSVIVNMGQLS